MSSDNHFKTSNEFVMFAFSKSSVLFGCVLKANLMKVNNN